MPRSRSSRAAWNSIGPKTIFWASRRACTSDACPAFEPSVSSGIRAMLSAPGVAWLPFLGEGPHCLPVVLGLEGRHFEREGGVHDQVYLVLDRLVYGQLGPADGPGRAVGELLRELLRLRQHLALRQCVVDQAHAGRIGALDEVAAHEEFL